MSSRPPARRSAMRPPADPEASPPVQVAHLLYLLVILPQVKTVHLHGTSLPSAHPGTPNSAAIPTSPSSPALQIYSSICSPLPNPVPATPSSRSVHSSRAHQCTPLGARWHPTSKRKPSE
jgi:hypothetical protein